MREIEITTRFRTQFVDVTDKIHLAVAESGIREGYCTLFVPHTTAAVTINENADPDVAKDIIAFLDQIAPKRNKYRHREGNSDAHIKSSLLGTSLQVIVTGGRIALGTWQGIYFCEFDGPRSRKLWVKII